jgi:general secretion pathway protein G
MTLLELLLALVVVGVLLTLGTSAYGSYMEQARVTQAEADIESIEGRVTLYDSANGALPASLAQISEQSMLDPWGHPYQYLDFTGLKGKGQMRKDHNLVPINSDYDLYSDGQDGESVSPLVAPTSRDDVIRANDGGYVGLASDY